MRAAYLIFSIPNSFSKFAERESKPKYYFSDNGLLNLFLFDRDTALLENEVAVALYDAYGEDLHYAKSLKTGVDVDFYLPEVGLAVQVAYSIAGTARAREIDNLVRLAQSVEGPVRLIVVTKGEEERIERDGLVIEVMPAWKFLLTVCR